MTRAEEAAEAIKKNYKPGEKLPGSTEISDRLNFPEATIRRAMRFLANEGFLEKVNQRYFVV